jgi:hypothetical protein
MKKKTAKSKETIPFFQEVHLLDPKPNKMFPQWMTDRLRFLRFYNAVACAECGKKSKRMWTMLVQFKAQTMSQFAMIDGKSQAPLTPVCTDHPLAPDFGDPKKKDTQCETQPKKSA